MLDWNDMMMDWWGIPFTGFWMIGLWFIFIIIAFLVYKDAEKRGMNGLLWFILVILPLVGIIFLIIYLILLNEKSPQISAVKNALQILDERYVKGEITKEVYTIKRKKT